MGDHHTPGPWHVGTGKAAVVVYAADGYAIADAKTYHGRHTAPAEANAALIAAAPDLLAALRTIMAPSPHYGATQAHRDHVAAARAAANAAIAKAEGRS